MGRGVSAGGGQSSLGYLFGGGEAPNTCQPPQSKVLDTNETPPSKPVAPSQPVVESKQIPVGVEDGSRQRPVAANHDSKTNNYLRTEGQNCGNFITDRPSTKVHAAPGGGSSLGYLFGGNGN